MSKFTAVLKKEFQTSMQDYLLLFTGSIAFLLFLKIFQGQRFLSFLVIISFVSLYVLWGVYHHSSEKTLNLKSVIEYVFIGATILLLLSVIFTV